jgi:hypothetical protein
MVINHANGEGKKERKTGKRLERNRERIENTEKKEYIELERDEWQKAQKK